MASSASSSSSSSSGSSELALLEKVLFRLASASDDASLSGELHTFLVPCLLKLASTQDGVRKKVMELLLHVNKRVKNNHNIKLPMDALVEQYQDPNATSFVLNFTIIYIKMGFPRLGVPEQAALVPALLRSLDGKPATHQDSLLLMITPILGQVVPANASDEKKRQLLGLDDRPQLKRLFHDFLLDYLLLPYGSHPSIKPVPQINAEDGTILPAEPVKAPAGLSLHTWARVAGETPGKAADLERTKVQLVKFLGSGALAEADVAMHLLVATADTRHSVVSQADTIMRKFSAVLDWDDARIVAKIYSLFLGTLVIKDKPAPKKELQLTPSNTRLRLKLMPYLLKSRSAATHFPACIQVTFDLLFGSANTNSKLRMMAVSFIHHVIFHCPVERLNAIGAVLMSALTRLVNEEKDSAKLRASCYVAIGKLGHKVPALVNKDVTVIQTFFEAISKEDQDTQLSVQEAMSLMAASFRKMDPDNLKFVEAMLATYMEKDESQVRLVAVQYAGEVFPSTHVSSRYILLLGAGDLKDEVGNEARSHLYSALNKLRAADEARFKRNKDDEAVDRDAILPDFAEMAGFVLDKAEIRAKTQRRHVVGDHALAFHPNVYAQVLDYLRTCLVNSAGVLPARDTLERPHFGAPAVAEYLGKVDPKLVLRLVEFAEKFLAANHGLTSAQSLLQLVGCTSGSTAGKFAGKIAWLKGLLDNTKEDVRDAVAQLYSLVAAQMDDKDFEKAVCELTRSFKEKGLEMQHGILLALGFSFGRRILLGRSKDVTQWGSYSSGTELILANLNHNQALLMSGSCSAVAELGRCGPLPLNNDPKDDSLKTSKMGLVKKLLAMMKSAKTAMKVREKAALALGQLCVGDNKFPHRKFVLSEILASASEIKDIELHFTVGEAVVYAALGPRSVSARDVWLVAEDDFKTLDGDEEEDQRTVWLIDDLCTKCSSTHPNVKQAACLWLLTLLKHGKNFDQVRAKLLDIQSALMQLLGDSNDLVQDAASKGLGLVYDSCSDEQRDQMVNGLLSTLMDGKRDVQKVSGETKVFEAGQMGKAPTGGNLSTYKELCSLATDLNQPDLVYKFMHLANYNSMWNSRKGAAFGFSSIAARAGEQLGPHLGKIVPKLYRYQFDPTPKIQESMSSIWNALVPETAKTVDAHLQAILEEIVSNLTSNQWRVRESCCMALQDLLRGRTLDDVLGPLPGLWSDLFRVMDDIKETVRVAAAKAAGALSRTCIKMCDVNLGAKAGEAAVKAVLPPLLNEGLSSGVAEVRSVAIQTIVKITKSSGALLKPHLAVLIPSLLEATSELEGKDLNYLSVRLANDAGVQEKLDLARIAAARSSSMMECVNFVLQFVDADTLQQLVPRLIDLIKKNSGLGAKGTTAHVITTLTHQCPLDLQPFTGKILAAFVSGLADRNAAVRKTYASAIGHLLKTAKDSSIEKLFAKLRTTYMDKTDESSQWAVAYTFQAVNQHNPDRMKSHASQSLPLVFLAMHEAKRPDGENEEILSIWEEVWSDGTPGTEGGLRLHLKEIMSLLSVAMEAQQWKLKAQSARAMGTVASKLGGQIPAKEHRQLMTILLNALAGRTWDGKEAVVRALADVCVDNRQGTREVLAEEGDNLTAGVLMQCLLRECKKERVNYRIVALEATGRVLQGLELYGSFDDLFDIVFPLIKKAKKKKEEEKKEETKKEEEKKEKEEEDDTNKEQLELRHSVYTCLAAAWPPASHADLQHKHLVSVLQTLEARVQSTTRQNQLCIVKCLGQLLNKWQTDDQSTEETERAFVETGQILSAVLAVPKANQLRTEALGVLATAIGLLAERKIPDLANSFRDEVAKSLDDVVKDVSADAATKARAREIRTELKAISSSGEEKMAEDRGDKMAEDEEKMDVE